MSGGEGRIEKRFAALSDEGRAGLIAFITAGDPDHETSQKLLAGLPGAGADFVELGMPFSDPMADGPLIQASSLRALKAGTTLKKTLGMVSAFRRQDDTTPIVLMGYFNPILAFGIEAFAESAGAAGVDGLIVVDLPPEEEAELAGPAKSVGLRLIRLVAPTSLGARLARVLEDSQGFLYYISMTGITGDSVPAGANVSKAVEVLKEASSLPVAVGFGIKTATDVRAMAKHADAVVVGSAIVGRIEENLDQAGAAKPDLEKKVLDFVGELAESVRLS